jgi:hypothetical protein
MIEKTNHLHFFFGTVLRWKAWREDELWDWKTRKTLFGLLVRPIREFATDIRKISYPSLNYNRQILPVKLEA